MQNDSFIDVGLSPRREKKTEEQHDHCNSRKVMFFHIAKGYKVTKSKTSKGVRIMVGPAKDRDAADASRKRITGDESLGMKSAWIIEWVPLDKR